MNASLNDIFAQYDRVIDLIMEKMGLEREEAMTIGCRLTDTKAAPGPMGSDWHTWVSACLYADPRTARSFADVMAFLGTPVSAELTCIDQAEVHLLCNGVVPERWWTSVLFQTVDRPAQETPVAPAPAPSLDANEVDPGFAALTNERALELAKAWFPGWIASRRFPLSAGDYLSCRQKVSAKMTRERLAAESKAEKAKESERSDVQASGSPDVYPNPSAEETAADATAEAPDDVPPAECPAELVQQTAELAGVTIPDVVEVLDYKRRDTLDPKHDRKIEPIWSALIGILLATSGLIPCTDPKLARGFFCQVGSSLGRQGCQIRRYLANGKLPSAWRDRLPDLWNSLYPNTPALSADSANHPAEDPSTANCSGAEAPSAQPISAPEHPATVEAGSKSCSAPSTSGERSAAPTLESAPVPKSAAERGDGVAGETAKLTGRCTPSPADDSSNGLVARPIAEPKVLSVTQSKEPLEPAQPVAPLVAQQAKTSVVEAAETRGSGGDTTMTKGTHTTPSPTPSRSQEDEVKSRRVDAAHRMWHVSALNLLHWCGLAFEFTYLAPEVVIRTNVRRIEGQCGHRILAALCEAKRLDQELSNEEISWLLLDELNHQWIADIIFTPEEKAAGEAQVKETILRRVTLGVNAFRDKTLPGLHVAGVEVPFEVQTKWGWGLKGRIDLVEPDRITDWKFRTEKKNQRDADTSLQLTCYTIGYKVAYAADPPSQQRLGSVVITPAEQKAYVDFKDTARSRSDRETFLRRVNQCDAAVGAGAFLPADPGHWMCSSRYCDFWDRCAYGDRGRTKLAA